MSGDERTTPRLRRPKLILLVGGGLGLLYAFIVTQLYVWIRFWQLRFTWLEAIRWSVPELLIWSAVIPLIVWAARRFPLERSNLVTRVPAHLAASVAVSTLVLALLWASNELMDWSTFLGAPRDLLSAPRYRYGVSFHTGIMIYWAVVSITQATEYYGRYRDRQAAADRLESQLARSQLRALQMQLDPHFLFNTLNSVSVLMKRDVKAADDTLANLSTLLRMTLDRSSTQTITLEQEFEFLDHYLQIQKTRFGDRLTVTVDVDEGLETVEVPTLILQPLVENAIKHGIGETAGPGRISIRGRRKDDSIELTVTDNGPGLTGSSASHNGRGIGLSNTEARLEMLYPGRYQLDVDNEADGGVTARIVLPAVERETRV